MSGAGSASARPGSASLAGRGATTISARGREHSALASAVRGTAPAAAPARLPDGRHLPSVSERSIEIVREVIDAFNSGVIERILAVVHPEFEGVVPPQFSAEPDTYRGHDGIRRYLRTFVDAMDEIRFEPERFWEGGNAVVVTMRLSARGRLTSIPVEQRFAQVWTVRDGLAMSVCSYASLSEALEAAGLPADARASG
jgi:ketosteroid isomerase-like protein